MKNFFLILAVSTFLFFLARAFAGEPGGASDPVVTKSFLEEAYGWRVTTLLAGEKLSMEQGSEAVLRSGKAFIVASKAGGLADLTGGQELGSRILIPANHYLLSPSGDGRGIQALTTSVLLTRGVLQ